ncbi:MAG: arginase family protein [Bacteroidia bacterium]|nr:arginase family protein [Bacteroidia bacterium]NND11064.1 arginase family protein [Flavobacteriaceae bacterium]NNK28811.1 arginase family protein [Flavobacteriaceae bacterium]RZV69335.1 MAG: arginase family protein [Flavobacteriaceae bacterium]
MKIFFPQWQGSGTGKDIKIGAKTIKAFLNDPEILSIPLSKKKLEKKHYINAHEALVEQLSSFRQILLQHKPKKLHTIGGDCGLEIIPVSYLSSIYNNLGVIWFDAHADINLPKDSSSSNFHGMPLRTLLGEGNSTLRNLMFSELKPNQIHYLGLRDIDSAEQEKIVKEGIYAPLTMNVAHLTDRLKKNRVKYLYIHFDVDCLDPGSFDKSYFKIANGLTISETEACIRHLKSKFKIVGTSILESTAATEEDLGPIANIVKLLYNG